jgi:signal transduction histidine kinase
MNTIISNGWFCVIGCALWAATAFIADLFLPLGIAGGLLYVPTLFFAAWFPSSRGIVAACIVVCVLIFAGFLLSPSDSPWIDLTNRLLTSLALVFFSILLLIRMHEVEEIKQHEETLKRDMAFRNEAAEKLRQSERLAAIGQMVTGLAHESRNALQLSQACLDILRIKMDDRVELHTLLNDIQKAQNQLHHLYEEVRLYAAPVKLVREPHDLRAILDEIWGRLVQLEKSRSLSLTHDITCSSSVCPVDAQAIGRVFRNILENSLNACNNPVRIQIKWQQTEWPGGRGLRISIRDNGPGLTPEARQRIFEPFFTTKSQGTGLGMAISRRIVEAHEGKIDVGPDDGPGAEILIALPMG